MGAIVTVTKNGMGFDRLVGELARWAEASAGVDFEHGGDLVEVKFGGSTDPGKARTMVEDVLRSAEPLSWHEDVDVEAVSTGS